MKIVVLQRHSTNLQFIKEEVAEINAVLAEEIIFIYSSSPGITKFVDGVIPKEGDHQSLIARIITSELDGATAESIRAAFPEIKTSVAW